MKRAKKPFGATWLAIFAAVALLAQFAGTAVAQARPAGQMVELCSSHGVRKVFVPAAPGEQTPGPCTHCDHCLAPALAVDVAPAALAAEPVTYTEVAVVHQAAVETSPYAARAPPRPPSQAPPSTLNI